jgi:hypothetical protein
MSMCMCVLWLPFHVCIVFGIIGAMALGWQHAVSHGTRVGAPSHPVLFGLRAQVLACAHGCAVRGVQEHVERKWVKPNTRLDLSWRDIALSSMHVYSQRTSGTFVLRKQTCVLWHYGDADRDFGDMQVCRRSGGGGGGAGLAHCLAHCLARCLGHVRLSWPPLAHCLVHCRGGCVCRPRSCKSTSRLCFLACMRRATSCRARTTWSSGPRCVCFLPHPPPYPLRVKGSVPPRACHHLTLFQSLC